ncbi:DUF389 domain-containing protein [Methanobacterium sp. VT]|uniref:DUF389 domain-containing protein n=1 Tax=Methanobacterium spitsbergense TaxID=2874285 RepID=A0A8T5V0Z4_9EURY|nr:DUF389 domain-containing protein [Methanobacterium spitsbergense]
MAGIATAIVIGYILTLPISNIVQPLNIDQIMSRTSPRILDLLAALVTGLEVLLPCRAAMFLTPFQGWQSQYLLFLL